MKYKVFSIVLAMAIIGAGVFAGEEGPWFDLKTCAYCKNFDMGNGEYIVDHIDGMYHLMDNGFLAIMVVEDDYKEAFAKAGESMQKVAAEMEKTGKIPQMCGHCTTYGELLMSGAKMQEFNSDAAIAYMMTSDDPELVKKLHAFAERNNTEMAKWDEARDAESAGE